MTVEETEVWCKHRVIDELNMLTAKIQEKFTNDKYMDYHTADTIQRIINDRLNYLKGENNDNKADI